jgi:hypothetical protein
MQESSRRDDTVLGNLTGYGLKQPGAIGLADKELAPIPPTLDALRERIERSHV